MLPDTHAEEHRDRITALASTILKTTNAFVSLINANRQRLFSKKGISAFETGRDISLPEHAILDEKLLVGPDARQR